MPDPRLHPSRSTLCCSVADDDMAADVERLRDSWADLIEQTEGWLDYRPAPSEGAQMHDVIAQARAGRAGRAGTRAAGWAF